MACASGEVLGKKPSSATFHAGRLRFRPLLPLSTLLLCFAAQCPSLARADTWARIGGRPSETDGKGSRAAANAIRGEGDSHSDAIAEPDKGLPSKEIQLRAGHVEIEGPFNRLSLSRGVELTVYRYHVTADRLTLDRSPKGILVDGDARVAFCPCSGSPLSVAFRRATVAPPTDLLLKNATFRACGIPVFWLPVFWLRSPSKVGLLTPTLAWRGPDGPWIGTGLHVPIAPRAGSSVGAIDTMFGAYILGGWDLGLQARTASSTTFVRWDHRKRSMLQVEAVGYRHWAERGSLAWQLDALRGERGRLGPVTFEAATRNYDRLRAETIYADGHALYAAGIRGDVARAGAFGQTGELGPTVRWGIGTALGSAGQVDSSLLVLGQTREMDTANAMALHASDLGLDWRPGPLTLRWMMHERWLIGSGAKKAYNSGLIGTEVKVGAPVVREFGSGRTRMVHWVEPFTLATAAWRDSAGGYGQAGPGPVSSLQAGLVSKVGSQKGSAATTLEVRAGSVVSDERHSNALVGRWLTSGTYAAIGGHVGWAGERIWLSSVRTRIGRSDGLAIRSALEGRDDVDPSQIRWFLDEAWSPWQAGWYSRNGWLARGAIDVGIGRQFATTAGVAYDLTRRTMVMEQAAASYRHPCGCMAVSTWMNWRAGRNGWDVLLALHLMP